MFGSPLRFRYETLQKQLSGSFRRFMCDLITNGRRPFIPLWSIIGSACIDQNIITGAALSQLKRGSLILNQTSSFFAKKNESRAIQNSFTILIDLFLVNCLHSKFFITCPESRSFFYSDCFNTPVKAIRFPVPEIVSHLLSPSSVRICFVTV